jgi:hypothetical protein
MKRLSTFLLVILAIAVLTANASSQTVDLAPYLNLTTGRTFGTFEYYHDSGVGWTFGGYEIECVFSLGNNYKGLTLVDAPDWSPSWFEVMKQEADGHYWIGINHVPGLDVYLPPPGPIDGVMDLGETVVWEFVDYDVDRSEVEYIHRWSLTLLDVGISFTTPAGTFDDCALILFDDFAFDPGYPSSYRQFVYWVWARDVGEIFLMSMYYDADTGEMNPEIMRILHMLDPLP